MGAEVLSSLAAIGALLSLTAAGKIKAWTPVGYDVGHLFEEVRANKEEILARLRVRKRYLCTRTAVRLRGTTCPDCHSESWVINWRGDGWCGQCYPKARAEGPESSGIRPDAGRQ